MTYTPPKVQVTGARGPQGISDVLLHPSKPLVRIVMRHKDKNGVNSEETFTLNLSEQEDAVKKLIQSGSFYVSLNSDEKKMYSIRPVKGVYKVRVRKLAAEENKEPAPKTNTTFETPYDYWMAILEIVEGKEKGMQFPLILRYWFEEVVKDGKSIVALEFHPKSPKHGPMLEEFLKEFGVWDYGEMSYKDNILPEIQKRLVSAKKVVQVVVKDGWIDSILGSDDVPDTE
jgi:hypothetical protein